MSAALLRRGRHWLGAASATVRGRGVRGSARLAYDWANKLPLVEFGLRRLLLPPRIRWLDGPRRVAVNPSDVLVITVVRNGEAWARSFLAHHRALGVHHFVVLDNGSVDRTVELFSGHRDVTLLQTHAAYSAYENTMKRYLASRYGAKRWCLCVDVDELFDFPQSDRVPLSAFLKYCDERSYNAVVTQMLDMFSDAPLRDVRSHVDDDIGATYRFYDTSAIRRSTYVSPVPDDRIQMHHGGVRKAVFGTDNGLTKISLFKMDGELRPFVQWHHTKGARIADVSTVLLHYPFVEGFAAKVAAAVEDGRYGYLTSDEYGAYQDGLKSQPEIRLKLATARKLEFVNQLVDEGFLVASDGYLDWVNRIATAEEGLEHPKRAATQ